ncbi:MAG: hypothetical protein JSR60_08865 [Proteobacteria bacterium]|nr:hypothetical protein [Pseudomonadota bacterium]
MSLTGHLVTPNNLETRFGHFAPIRAFRHPALTVIAVLAMAAGAAAYANGWFALPH